MGKEGFEDRLAKLEALTETIRETDIPLEKAMELFDEGIQLSEGLEKELKGFERKIEILKNDPGIHGDDEPELEEFPAEL